MYDEKWLTKQVQKKGYRASGYKPRTKHAQKKAKGSEHENQVALFDWAELAINQYPELEMLYAVPNGGKRTKREGYNMKREGVKRGVFDVSLDVPSSIYHGLRIEMKYGRNNLTDDQKLFKDRYAKYGYRYAICYTTDSAIEAITNYLKEN